MYIKQDGAYLITVCSTDRAILTATGKQALHRAWPIYGSGIQKYFASHLPAKEAAVLNRLLRRVARDE
ncbi:MAG: hypothetical protein JO343_02600 [Candidatus Eremiobacteraeota bacterium]|nr:hypothetical protein [Candidatus Eremiobacteraeota bacterium]